MFDDIAIEDMLRTKIAKDMTLIDVRSPQEFADGTIPGSVNIPIFDDEERAMIGTLYKQVGVQAAKDKGLEIVSAKLPAFIRSIDTLPGKKAVFCWRGGMRSKTTATVLALMGIHTYRIIGGVRAYRRWVVQRLESFDLKPECIVLNGYTGTGKSQILRDLDARGYPVLDLEALAAHRGSIFGHIGLEPNNQKTFEALLVEKLEQLNDQPYLLMEAESKRIGKAVMPEFLVQGKEKGRILIIDLPVEARVDNILGDYDPFQYKADCIQAFERIRRHIHTPIASKIAEYLEQDQFGEAVKLMLQHYYDERYQHAMIQYGAEEITLHAASVGEAIQLVESQLKAWGLDTR
jgi:tRNA 2-selenouridine synthase